MRRSLRRITSSSGGWRRRRSVLRYVPIPAVTVSGLRRRSGLSTYKATKIKPCARFSENASKRKYAHHKNHILSAEQEYRTSSSNELVPADRLVLPNSDSQPTLLDFRNLHSNTTENNNTKTDNATVQK